MPDMPEDLQDRLEAMAAERGLSVRDYLLSMAEREADTIGFAELSKRIRKRGRFSGVSGGDIIRELRDEHS